MLTDWVHIGGTLAATFAGILAILFLVVQVEQWLDSPHQSPAAQPGAPAVTPLSINPKVVVSRDEDAA